MHEPYGDAQPPRFWDNALQVEYVYNFNPLAVGSEAWNAFPLTAAAFDYSGEHEELGEPQTLEPKRAEIAPLSRDCSTAENSTDQDASGEEGDANAEASADADASAEGAADAEPEADAKPAAEAKPEAKPEEAEGSTAE